MDSCKDVYILIPQTWEDVLLHGKREMAGEIKITNQLFSKGRDFHEWSMWAQCNHKHP